ncbi:MAG: DUF1631 family protein [Pseudomonadota bacterium]|nr:DUF1631 family protein [Pseudomonadota bacterium]
MFALSMLSVSIQSPLLRRARQEASFLASSMLDRGIEVTVAVLEEAERASKSVPTRMLLGEAMATLLKRKAELRAAFPARLDEAVARALDAARGAGEAPARQAVSLDELALVEDTEVSRFVEASRLQQTVMPVVEEPLARLDSLMSSALGLPVVRADLNPLRPDVVCGALLDLLEAVPEEAEVRAQWVRYIAKPFARELKGLYEAVVKLLEEQGVEEARYRLKLTEGGALPAKAPAPRPQALGGHREQAHGGGPAVGEAMASDADQLRQRRGLFPRMGDLAKSRPAVPQALMRDFLYRPQWVTENDEPLPAAYYEAVRAQAAAAQRMQAGRYDEMAAARTHEQARAMSVVDRPARSVALEQSLSPEHWGDAGSALERTRTLMELKAQATRISQALGLDAVRTLVEQVAGDERMLAPVREAFVAMEPALLRMAMADPRFFGDDHHPARRLVEGVAQRSFKYNDEYATDFEQFMAPVRQAVRALNAQARPQASDFATRLRAIEEEWRHQDDAEKQVHEPGLRSMHFAQERQALADKIASEFGLRSDLDGVPNIVVDFLFRDWSLVIAHAQLTDDRGQLDPGGYLAVVTDLLWSVKREAALRQPARLFQVVPGLVQTLRRGLDMLGKEPEETAAFFDALMRYHDPVLRLRRLRSARDAEASGLIPLDVTDSVLASLPDTDVAPLERPQPRAAEQPWLGRHELAAAGFEVEAESVAGPLTDLDALDAAPGMPGDTDMAGLASTRPLYDPVTDIGALTDLPSDLPPLDERSGAAVSEPATLLQEAEGVEDAEARTRALLARLRVGDWVDLKVRGGWRRAQLQWTSDNGTLYMFISHGGRPHSMTQRTCAKLIRNRHLRPVDAGAVVDKALRRLGDAAREPETVY